MVVRPDALLEAQPEALTRGHDLCFTGGTNPGAARTPFERIRPMTVQFTACINTPGYLPDSEPQAFATPTEAWNYLLDEYAMSWNDVEMPEGWNAVQLPSHLKALYDAGIAKFNAQEFSETGYFWLPTPGIDPNHPTDLGFNYSVQIAY